VGRSLVILPEISVSWESVAQEDQRRGGKVLSREPFQRESQAWRVVPQLGGLPDFNQVVKREKKRGLNMQKRDYTRHGGGGGGGGGGG